MTFLRLSLWCLCLLASPTYSASSQLLLDLRSKQSNIEPSEWMETAGIALVRENSAAYFYLRSAHTGFDWTRLDYSVEGTFSPLSWFTVSARLLHRNRLNEHSCTTALLGVLSLRGRFPRFIEWFGKLGLYRRTHRLLELSALPRFTGSFYEGDLATSLGFTVLFSETSRLSLSLSTFEEIDVYNINNPVVEATWNQRMQGWELQPYLRYQALLGFGRAEAWVGGIKIHQGL